MISLMDAKKIVEKRFPEAKVEAAYKYTDQYYLFVAPSVENDVNDPFYIVDIDDGKCRFLNPMEDFDAFDSALSSTPLKKYQ